MNFYHGTQIGGLKELKPFNFPGSNLDIPAVYLTTKRQVALHYISIVVQLKKCTNEAQRFFRQIRSRFAAVPTVVRAVKRGRHMTEKYQALWDSF